MTISQEQFEYVCTLARETSAQIIGSNKTYLINNRLAPIARGNGFNDSAELIDFLRSQTCHGDIHHSVIEALTTNETYFFRDLHPFDALEKSILPELIEKKKQSRELTLWSAACSTGQEAYSFAMMLCEKFPALVGWKVKIIGTDINSQVIEKARTGKYTQLEVNRGLPATYLSKYFTNSGTDWYISPRIREMVEFKQLNLVSLWRGLPQFDIVLLRNVLIYFDVKTKKKILDSIKSNMHDSSVLFLGAAETTTSIDPEWEIKTSGRTVYYKKNTTGLN